MALGSHGGSGKQVAIFSGVVRIGVIEKVRCEQI